MGADIVKKAPFIVIDGLDGAGKTTQLTLLSDRATREGRPLIFTREPGGAPLGEALRELFKSELGSEASSLTQFMMMWASRRDYLEKVVWPNLENNIPVFSDRGDSSTLAYQVYGRQELKLWKDFWYLRELIFGNNAPTLYIFLDVPPDVAYDRVHGDISRGAISHFDAKPLEFYEDVYDGFREFGIHSSISMVSVDGTRKEEEIHKDIYRLVSKACGW